MQEASDRDRRPWYSPGIADAVFVGCALLALFHSRTGAMDDPGLGWHLRIADQMWESGGFLYQETFCPQTEGQQWVTYAWLGDILLRMSYAWSGLNGIAVLMALCIGLFLRVLYTHMVSDGVPWLGAVAWTLLAAQASRVGWTARPNMYTFVGLALTVVICERFHRGAISRRQTLWLIPLFFLWANMHSGFLAGALVLAVTYLVELSLSCCAPEQAVREAARSRLRWLTGLGLILFVVTLVNPYGLGLYMWTISALRDPFIQQSSTTEWRAPDFTAPGWSYVELVILLFPLLAAISRRKVPALSLALSIIWLHFALTGVRYAALWIIVAVPTLALWSCDVAWLQRIGQGLAARTSAEFRARFVNRPGPIPLVSSFAFAICLMIGSRWLPPIARHHNLPAKELDVLLEMHQGERVFHSANWGGYLTWHGWDLKPRFRPWIDDRIDVHGRTHTEEYFDLIRAAPGWSETLDGQNIEILALPVTAPLTRAAVESLQWREVYRGKQLAIFRRTVPSPDEAAKRP